MVNSDCRQIAWSMLFAHTCLDYSSKSLGIVAMLKKESSWRARLGGRAYRRLNTRGPLGRCLPLGLCIRKITVENRFNLVFGLGDRLSFLRKAEPAYHEFRLSMLSIIRKSSNLPHLETIHWHERVFPPRLSLTLSTTCCPAQVFSD
jgi:hypothetical protein